MPNYLLIVLIIFNISNCFSLKYSLPKNICNNNISSIAIGDEVEYNDSKQPEVSLFSNGNFWYYPDTDPDNQMQGWTQINTNRIHASFRRNFFYDQTECETNNGSYLTINREFILITFHPNQSDYDIFNISAKNFGYQPKQLFDNPVFNESKIQRDKKIDAALNWKQNIVIFQGENYFIIKFNENQNCGNLSHEYFGPLKISFIDNELTQVTSAIYDNTTDELYIIQSDQVFINKAFINNDRISIAQRISKGNLTNILFDCGNQPLIEPETPSSSDNGTDQTVHTESSESSMSSSQSLSESMTENNVSLTTTQGGKKKGFEAFLFLLASAIWFILMALIFILAYLHYRNRSEQISYSTINDLPSRSVWSLKIHMKDSKVGPALNNFLAIPSESVNKGSDCKKTDNTRDSAQSSPDWLMSFPTSPKSVSESSKSESQTSLDSKDLAAQKSAESLHSIDSSETAEKDKPKPSEPKTKSHPNSKEFSKPDSSSREKSSKKRDNTRDSAQSSPDWLLSFPTSPKSVSESSKSESQTSLDLAIF